MNEQVAEAQPENKQPPKAMVMKRQKYTNEEKREREEKELAELVEQNKQQANKPEATPEQEPEVTGEEKTFKKRYGDLRRHMQEKDKEVQGQIDALKKQLDEATKKEIKLPKSEQDIEAWAEQYPDVAAIVETIAIKKAKEQSDIIEKRVKALDEMQQNVTREKAESELLKFHPDFNEIKDTDEFHDWADTQPKWVQDALYENVDDAKSVARVIDLYKIDKGITNKKKATPSEKAAASSVKTKSAAAPEPDETAGYVRESEVAAMSIKEYEKRQEEILDAQRNGRFIYDVSRK